MTKINISQVILTKVGGSAHIYRQILATFAACLLSLTTGMSFGFTAVLLPQLQSDPNFPYDKSYDSWIASIALLAMLMSCFFSGLMSDRIGRRKGQLVVIFPFTIGWVIIGVATNNTVLLIGRFIIGFSTGAIRANSMVYVGELSDPKYRANFLFSSTMAINLGALISHAVGKYVHWQTSCYIFVLPNILCFAILMFLKESPLWLLSKGKIEEGIESFIEFRGKGECSEKELAVILQKSKEKPEETSSFKDTLNIIFSKPFMKSVATVFLLFIAVQWCGVNIISFYAQEIFEKTFSGDVDPFMLMLVTDCIRVLATVAVCMFAKILPRKITVVTSCLSTTIVLIGLVIYLYLNPVGLVWMAVICIVIYIAIASMMGGLAWSFVAEIFPAEMRGFGSGISSGMSLALLFISVKVTPEIMNKFGEEVMFLGFAGVTLFSGIFLSFILPETNGRSLQDIEDALYKKKVVEKDLGTDTLPTNSPA